MSLGISTLSFADGFNCEKPDENGVWWIPAEGFTKEEAEEASLELSKLISKGAAGRDFIEIENYFVMIRGYLYKEFLRAHKAEFKSTDKYLNDSFCEFLRTKAYYHH